MKVLSSYSNVLCIFSYDAESKYTNAHRSQTLIQCAAVPIKLEPPSLIIPTINSF